MESTFITYSTKAKAHELALLKLKSKDLSEVSATDLTNEYLDIYNSIYEVLNKNRSGKK